VAIICQHGINIQGAISVRICYFDEEILVEEQWLCSMELIVWLVGWLVRWLLCWLAGWLVGWLGGWLLGWLVGWLVGLLVKRLVA
jgi:hypothetical protein